MPVHVYLVRHANQTKQARTFFGRKQMTQFVQQYQENTLSLAMYAIELNRLTVKIHWVLLNKSYAKSESTIASDKDRSWKGLWLHISTEWGIESLIQKLANLISPSSWVNCFHDLLGNTPWVTNRLMEVAPPALSTWMVCQGNRKKNKNNLKLDH